MGSAACNFLAGVFFLAVAIFMFGTNRFLVRDGCLAADDPVVKSWNVTCDNTWAPMPGWEPFEPDFGARRGQNNISGFRISGFLLFIMISLPLTLPLLLKLPLALTLPLGEAQAPFRITVRIGTLTWLMRFWPRAAMAGIFLQSTVGLRGSSAGCVLA